MIRIKYIFVFLIVASTSCFSQTTFTNLDSLLSKNFDAINKRDSVSYLALINQSAVFNGKKAKNKSDSLIILQHFTDAFNDLITNLADMTSGADFSVNYSDYEMIHKGQKIPENGTMRIHANMIVNNTFSLKMPMAIVVRNGQFSLESPMTVMFLEGKE
ncbi:MAG: hypothetical protein V4580_17630 [Bacteroidota bacterium]